jgi:hypothetical protein
MSVPANGGQSYPRELNKDIGLRCFSEYLKEQLARNDEVIANPLKSRCVCNECGSNATEIHGETVVTVDVGMTGKNGDSLRTFLPTKGSMTCTLDGRVRRVSDIRRWTRNTLASKPMDSVQ